MKCQGWVLTQKTFTFTEHAHGINNTTVPDADKTEEGNQEEQCNNTNSTAFNHHLNQYVKAPKKEIQNH